MDRSVMPGLNDGICHKVGHGEMWLAGLLLPGNTTFFSFPMPVTLYICQRHARLGNKMRKRDRTRDSLCVSLCICMRCAPVFVYAHVGAYICERMRVYIESGHREVSALIRHAQKMSSICNDMGCDIRALLAGEMYCLSFWQFWVGSVHFTAHTVWTLLKNRQSLAVLWGFQS